MDSVLYYAKFSYSFFIGGWRFRILSVSVEAHWWGRGTCQGGWGYDWWPSVPSEPILCEVVALRAVLVFSLLSETLCVDNLIKSRSNSRDEFWKATRLQNLLHNRSWGLKFTSNACSIWQNGYGSFGMFGGWPEPYQYMLCTPINLVHYCNLAPLLCLKRLIVRHRVDQYWQLSRSSCNAWQCCVEIFMDTRFCTIGQYEWKVMSLIAPGVRERVKFDAIPNFQRRHRGRHVEVTR